MSKIKQYEYKTFGFKFEEVEEVKEEGRVSGYASTFGNMDLGFDVVSKGAFKKTLKENKGRFPILADHSPYDQIGWNERGSEDDTGLLVEGALMLGVQKARERYVLAKKALELKAPAGLSIGYMTVLSEPDSQNPRIRMLKELKLFEYSFVTFPMNTQAMVTAAKSIGAIDKARFIIEQCKAQDISLKDLEIALLQEAAHVDLDPTKLSQSMDNLIEKFKNN